MREQGGGHRHRARPRYNKVLTPRQQQIYDLYRQQKTNKEIADALGLKYASQVALTLDIILSRLGPGSQI